MVWKPRYHLHRWPFENCCSSSVKGPEMTWKPGIHLQRWIFEKSFTISVQVPEIMALKQRYHLRRWSFEEYRTISVKAPEMMNLKTMKTRNESLKKASLLEMWSWKNKESISICKMIPYFLGSHLWRGSREIVLRFQSCFIPDSPNDYMNLVQSIRVL